MGFWDFLKKEDKIEKRFKDFHKNLDGSFLNIRKDMKKVRDWINHLDNKKTEHHHKISSIELRLNNLEDSMEELKKLNFFIKELGLSKHKQTGGLSKQPFVCVQTPVQTPIQGDVNQILKSLTVMERAVVWVLLNTDLKLCYDDLSITLGKDKSTIRGQLNNIKRKSESLINEYMEMSGKKRFYINDELKNEVLRGITKKESVTQTLKRGKK